MRIVFFSDVHWRGIARHNEYTKVFSLMFDKLRTEIKPDLILCGGDIVHSKTQNITPEVIDKVTWMFKSLIEIAPVCSILGNHDGNLTNESRQDTISPIVNAIGETGRLKLFKQSCNYTVPNTNINLGVLSCFDKDGWSRVTVDPDKINIALFHGSVYGCSVDNEWVMSSVDQEADVELFSNSGFDFAFLGDIHKAQHLSYRADRHGNQKPWVSYPGSLIQQNYGESTIKGFHVWDIRDKLDWDVEFVALENDYKFLTVDWAGSVDDTIETICQVLGNKPSSLANKRIRIVCGQTVFPSEKKDLYDRLKGPNGSAAEVVFKAAAPTCSTTADRDAKLIFSATPTETETVARSQTSSLSRTSPGLLCQLYENHVKSQLKVSVPLTDQQITEGKRFIERCLEEIKTSEDESPRDVVWSLKSLAFDNLFRYGEGNVIDFASLNGIVGVFGPNRIGKSSCIGALMYALFNTTDRGPIKSAYVINKAKKTGKATAVINVAGVDYSITRTTEKAVHRKGVVDEEKATTKLVVERQSNTTSTEDSIVARPIFTVENNETRPDTDKVIRKLIGTPQDFLLTALSTQGGMHKFLEEGATQRKAFLNRLLDLDVFEKINQQAADELTKWSGVNKNSTTNLTSAVESTKNLIVVTDGQIASMQLRLSELEKERTNLQTVFLLSGGEQRERLLKTKTKLLADLASSRSGYEAAIGSHAVLQEQIATLSASLGMEKTKLVNLPTKEQLLATMENLNSGDRNVQAAKELLLQEQKTLKQQENSAKKLLIVPCGTQFPSCHYIADSHNDSQKMIAQAALVERLVSSYEALKAKFDPLAAKEAASQLQTLEQAVSKIQLLQTKISTNLERLSTSERLVDLSKENLDGTLAELAELDRSIEALPVDSTDTVEKRQTNECEIATVQETLRQLFKTVGSHSAKLEQLLAEQANLAASLEQQRIFDSVAQAFSKYGIPALVLKTKLPTINSELDSILAGVVPFRVSLETEPGSNILDVFIEDGNSKRVIELASGMEKLVASLAIRVALIGLSNLPKPDLFIVDEGWGTLDGNNMSKVTELLQSLKSRFKSIIVISHVDAIKEIADCFVTIADNGFESQVVANGKLTT